jgi:hypothetical protein
MLFVSFLWGEVSAPASLSVPCAFNLTDSKAGAGGRVEQVHFQLRQPSDKVDHYPGEPVRSFLINKNLSLYYWLKGKIGKQKALRIASGIESVILIFGREEPPGANKTEVSMDDRSRR